MRGFFSVLSVGLVGLMCQPAASGEATAKPQPVRAGDGWAIYAQPTPESWQELIAPGNLAAGKLPLAGSPPNDHNTGSDLAQLTDGVLAGASGRMWSDKRAMGWAYQPYARLTLDLGKVQPAGQVVLRLQVINENNRLPGRIAVALSEDGYVYSPVRELTARTSPEAEDSPLTFESLPADPPGIYAVVLNLGYAARYVRLDFKLRGTMVTDELAIVPAAGAVKSLPAPPEIATEYRDYVFDRRDQFRKMTAAGNLLAGRPVRYSPRPTQYLNIDEDDPLQLTDGKFGERTDEAIWFERGCVGWQGPPQVLIFADLGEPQPVDSVVIRLLGGAAQNALEFPDEVTILLSSDGVEYHRVVSRHKRGLDDLSADAYDLPEEGTPWVHNFRLPVGRRARYVAVQLSHKKQYFVADELAVVKGAADLPDFEPQPETRVTLVTEGVAFVPVWGNVQPVCRNFPLRSRFQKQDARPGDQFDRLCHVVLDVPDTLDVLNADLTATQVEHEGRQFKRYRVKWAGEGTDIYLQSRLPAGETDVLYTSGDSGEGPQNERRITWQSLVVPKSRVPRRLHVSLSWAESTWLHKTWPGYLTAQRHMGFNAVGTMPCYWREAEVEANQKVLGIIREHGFQVVQIESPAGAVSGDRDEAETKSILDSGKEGHVCPAYRGQFYRKEHDSFARHAAWIEPDLIFYDIEAYWDGAVNAPYCQRCRERYDAGGFASWEVFRAAMGREIHVDMKTAIDKSQAAAGVKRPVEYGSYRTEPITPLNDGLFSFANTYPDLLQMAMPSLYVAGNPLAVAKSIAANRARMQTNDIIPWLSTGCYGEYNPVRTRDMILEAFANGARGITYYWYGHFDAAHFRYHSEAINIVTPIEDLFMDGRPLTDLVSSHEQVKVCGMGLDAELAVLVSNYNGVPEGTRVTVRTAAPAGTPVRDLHSGEAVGTAGADGSFTVELDDQAAHLYYIGRKYIEAVKQGPADE